MSTNYNIFKNGSQWLRADFHLHTKADAEFWYDDEENEFCKKYIEQLKTKEVGVGIITNHNKFDKDEFVALYKKAKKEGIGLFPGVEFSLKEGIHILIVFDHEWYKGETDCINKFLENAFYGIKNYDKPNYPNSNFDLKDTTDALDKINLGYFIVLAHIDEKKGLFKELRGETLEHFIEQEPFEKVLAVQKSGNLKNYERLCKLADRKIACVEGSDNAQGGIEAIGSGRVTYIKIGDFNFEALQYALTDCNRRVSPKDKPVIKNSYIKSIAIEGGLLDKTRIDFSPELNNLIGIRGSGKSSILEIIRYTLGISLSKSSADPNYKNGLIEYVLKSGGKSIVTIVNKEQGEYHIEKIYGQKADIFKDDMLHSDISVDAIFDSPVYFGQKDLSNKKDEPNKELDFEADILQRLIGSKLKPVQAKIESKKKEVESLVFEIKKIQNLKGLKKETETSIENSKHQLKIYKEKGVEEKLNQQTLFDADVSKIKEFENSVGSFVDDTDRLIADHQYLINQEISGSPINEEIFNVLDLLKNELDTEFKKIKKCKKKIKKIHNKIETTLLKINEKKDGFKEEFAKIKREFNTVDINPDKFLNLNRIINTSELKLKEIKKTEKKRKEINQSLKECLYELNELWREEYELLKFEVERINKAESKLTIEVGFKERRDKFVQKLKETFKGSGIRDAAYQQIETNYRDFVEIYKDSSKLSDILNENKISDFKQKLWKNLTELITYKVENKITIKYNGKPLDKHSLGQRASALILFLLAQKENDVLIIDQPEDDLDNQTIYEEVIKEIKKIKGDMQFIFATHNANIPVLGDSEKVVVCNFDEEKIAIESGTIDCQKIQRFIVDIMEGGDEAFNRRKDIYRIWNIEKDKK